MRSCLWLAVLMLLSGLTACSEDDRASAVDAGTGPGGRDGNDASDSLCDRVDCDDGVPCTVDACDEATGTCRSTVPDVDQDGHAAYCVNEDGDLLGDDCDDFDAARHPGAIEVCEPGNANAVLDEDCDATTFGARDDDTDGYEDARCCNPTEDGTLRCGGDCDDGDDTAHPTADETCDGIDNDCDADALIDEGAVCTGCPDVCDDNADCIGNVICHCRHGYMGDGVTCVDVDECAVDNGGCDDLTICTNSIGADATCGACPDGYIGNGASGCTPTLVGLALTGGAIAPAFLSAITSYAVSAGIATQTITLRPSAASDATITIQDQAVTTGTTWRSDVLNLGDNTINIDVRRGALVSRYVLTVNRRGAQQAYIKASNPDANDGFGGRVAMSGDTLVVSASSEDSSATSVNGRQDDNTAMSAGAVYVFVRVAGVWVQQAYLKASNAGAADGFGGGLAISGDTIVVSAPSEDSGATTINGDQTNNASSQSGAAYVFVRAGNTWSQQAYLKPSNGQGGDAFGTSVAISGDTIVVSARGEDSGAIGVGGDQGDNSALDSGAAYVFVRSGNTWSQQAYLKASNTGAGDSFGESVDIDGETIVVGAYNEDSNATGVGGNQGDDSAASAGAAYVFVRSGNTWSQQAYLKASNTNASDLFGWRAALSGNTIVVGAYGEDSNATGVNGNQMDESVSLSGAAYVFTRSGNTWSQQAYLKASNPYMESRFGFGLAVAGDTIVVGALGESGSAWGIDGDPTILGSESSGAVYVFR
jgi:hypothetical protein